MSSEQSKPQYAEPKHWVSKTCIGERCRCGKPASHKVGEEIPHDAMGFSQLPKDSDPGFYGVAFRHNLTAYVCCDHFGEIMGWLAREACHGR